jgi:cytochrome P450
MNMEKSPIFIGSVAALDGQTGVSLAMNEHHTRQRKALGYLFTNSALRHLEDIILVHIHKLVGAIDGMTADNRAVDVSSWCKQAQEDHFYFNHLN